MADADNTPNPSTDNVATATKLLRHPVDALLQVRIGLRLLNRHACDALEEAPSLLMVEELFWLSERIDECLDAAIAEMGRGRWEAGDA
ncbi:MAG: hypothetical protein ACFCVH_13890 [Alphaproteobacteria bacterium]